MNGNLDWTQALGAAFTQQPADVMKSVQQLRVQARAAGTLVNTPQQQVVMDGDNIRIVPAQPNTIYVPVYDPAIVYETPVGYAGPFLTFGMGYPVGAWLGYQCDWDDFGIWLGPWSPGWPTTGDGEIRAQEEISGGRGNPIRVDPARWCAVSIGRRAVCLLPGSLQPIGRRSASRASRPVPRFLVRPPDRTIAAEPSRCPVRPARPRRANSSADTTEGPRHAPSAPVDK